MVCGVAINYLEITLILQPARIDVKIGPARAHGNRLHDSMVYWSCFNSLLRSVDTSLDKAFFDNYVSACWHRTSSKLAWNRQENLKTRNPKRPSIKDVRSQGRGSSYADVRTFWFKKFWIFWNFWCIRRELIFRDFVRTSFMDGP